MIIIMQAGATKTQVAAVVANVKSMGLDTHVIVGEERTVVAVVGNERGAVDRDTLGVMDGVERIMPVLAPYKMASREVHPSNTLIPINGSQIGDKQIVLIAGAREVDSRDQLFSMAQALKGAGATALYSGGIATTPYTVGGHSDDGLALLAEVRQQTGLPIVIEAADPLLVPTLARYVDILEVAPHNMQNYPLLNVVGDSQKTILLKRGIVNTMEELLMAAEYILSRGNNRVILCEGGIRTYESYTNNITFDVNAIPVLKTKTHLPIIVDASHAAGDQQFAWSLSKAAVAAGADGLILEVECDPQVASADRDESHALSLEQFGKLVTDLRRVALAVDRTI